MDSWHTHIFCQPQQVFSLRLGEEVETVKVGHNDQHVQYNVTADNIIIAQKHSRIMNQINLDKTVMIYANKKYLSSFSI